ncbi:MAG TPA: glycosyltransferase [Thermoanaerobaculales bacterium]|nr:glycosyltransferase [Thermoanaerobaculales bacterium]
MSGGPCLSVVIPTRDRRRLLEQTLAALDRQRELPCPFEVVVVDDGSTDGTGEWLQLAQFGGFTLQQIATRPGGPARARNLAIRRAAAPRVLLLGDDTVPAKDLLAAHLAAAAGRDVAVQGRIDWDPARPVTEVMRFLAPAGPQFWFEGLGDGGPVPFSAVLASNLSAPTRWFREEPFDERFTEACLEDTELAWRWQQRGWPAVYSATAVCWHRHHYDRIEPFLDRQRRAGRWARLAAAIHPALRWRVALQPIAFAAVSALRVALRWRRRDLWDLRCRLAFAKGYLSRPRPGVDG